MPPPRRRGACRVCDVVESKYACPKCLILYCSVACFKKHNENLCKATTSSSKAEAVAEEPITRVQEKELEEEKPLRPLTSLKWPYVPEESAYPDPLKRDDPKALQVHQYEAIATSSAVRQALADYPRLPEILASIDKLRGSDREFALQRALGVTDRDINEQAGGLKEPSEDVKSLRELAEAVEAAVRGDKGSQLGLDWEG